MNLTAFENILNAESNVKRYAMVIGDLNINIVRTKKINNEHLDMSSGHGFRSFIIMHIK